MAPKKPTAKAKANAKMQTVAPKRQREEDQNPVDAADGPAAAKKQKQEHTVENYTLKALKDNFKGFTDFSSG